MGPVEILEKAWPYVIVGAPGLFAAWKAWTTRRGDLVKIAQEAAGFVVENLREEVARLSKKLSEVEEELQALQREHTRMIADKDARIALLEGEKRQLEAQVAAYQRVLARHNITVPKVLEHFEVDEGHEPVAKAVVATDGL